MTSSECSRHNLQLSARDIVELAYVCGTHAYGEDHDPHAVT